MITAIALLISVWVTVAAFNISAANNTCLRGREVNNRWYCCPDSIESVYRYYNPLYPSNWFGFKALFFPFQIPTKTWCDRISDEED